MAIDSSLFAVDIANATVITAGDRFRMSCIDGPAVVRSGRGAAILKRITAFKMNGAGALFRVEVKNSDWVDPAISEVGAIGNTTLDARTGCNQSGCDCQLTANSSWDVELVAVTGGTMSSAGSFFVLVDIDYPSVSSVTDPDKLVGYPTSILHQKTLTSIAIGGAVSSTWAIDNVDFFKAGYEYALQKLSVVGGSNSPAGFIGISNAAGMGGLTRIIPFTNDGNAIRQIIEYASKLQKGPIDIKFKVFTASSGSETITVIFDFVKRKI